MLDRKLFTNNILLASVNRRVAQQGHVNQPGRCLAISITFSVLILMTCLFIRTPLEFSVFPTVLLLATMLRLALNMASTRLILSDGHEGTDAAGRVIEAFGGFVKARRLVWLAMLLDVQKIQTALQPVH